MQNKEKRFALEDTLNQIYRNDYCFDSEHTQFSFFNADFILLNDAYIYLPENICTKIILTKEYMQIILSKARLREVKFEIKYTNIKEFSIKIEE